MVAIIHIDAALTLCVEQLSSIDRSICFVLRLMNKLEDLVTPGEVSAPVTMVEFIIKLALLKDEKMLILQVMKNLHIIAPCYFYFYSM